MNLTFHLVTQMLLIAAFCLLATAGYVLQRADRQMRLETAITADAVETQLEVQWMRVDAGFGLADRYPDLDLVWQTLVHPGVCFHYRTVTGERNQSFCRGPNIAADTVPTWFAQLYRKIFDPNHELSRSVAYHDRPLGTITVTPHADSIVANAWQTFYSLMNLAVISTLALCVLVYASISRALRPARIIVSGLEKMQKGELAYRLPDFDLREWQRIGMAVNRLAAHLEQALAERRHFALKLMTLQEEERRYLTRELHDEVGQCLTAIHAVSAGLSQTAESTCPELAPECRKISLITDRTMASLRCLVLRLRPAELDQLGLKASLIGLITGWNSDHKRTCYRLDLQGSMDDLPDPIPITLFRIIQESLTNIARHAAASQATVSLKRVTDDISPALLCTIKDNGIANHLPFEKSSGIGLVGISERVDELGGNFSLSIGKPSGLVVQIRLPLRHPLRTSH